MRAAGAFVAAIIATVPALAQPADKSAPKSGEPEYVIVAVETPEQKARRELAVVFGDHARQSPREITLSNGVGVVTLAEGEGFLSGPEADQVRRDIWKAPITGKIEGILTPAGGSFDNLAAGHFTITYVDSRMRTPFTKVDSDLMLFGLQSRAEALIEELPADRRYKANYTWAVSPVIAEAGQTIYFVVRQEVEGGGVRLFATVARAGRYGVITAAGRISETGLATFAQTAESLLKRIAFNPGQRFKDFNGALDRDATRKKVDINRIWDLVFSPLGWVFIAPFALVIVGVASMVRGKKGKT
ncbi:MAG: DUF2167 domain-containing protein [Hyphomonadaceae bacterium]